MLIGVLGPKPVGILVVFLLLTVNVIALGYAVHSWLTRHTYMQLSDITEAQVTNVTNLLELNEKLREKNKALEQSLRKARALEENVLIQHSGERLELLK